MDGVIQFWEGKILFVDGDIAMNEDCCCEDHCIVCTDGSSPNYLLMKLYLSDATEENFCDNALCACFEGPITLLLGINPESADGCDRIYINESMLECVPLDIFGLAAWDDIAGSWAIAYYDNILGIRIDDDSYLPVGGTMPIDCTEPFIDFTFDPPYGITSCYGRTVTRVTVEKATGEEETTDFAAWDADTYLPLCGCDCNVTENGMPDRLRYFEMYTTGSCSIACPGIVFEFTLVNDEYLDDCDNVFECQYRGELAPCTWYTCVELELDSCVELDCYGYGPGCSWQDDNKITWNNGFYIGIHWMVTCCTGVATHIYWGVHPDDAPEAPLDCTEDVLIPLREYYSDTETWGTEVCGYLVIPACEEEE
jgi:hypothetical protein